MRDLEGPTSFRPFENTLYYIPHMLSNGYLDMLSGAEQLNYDTNTIALVLIGASCGIIIIFGIVPTVIFLLYDKLCCCCCSCCLQPTEELVVFDPEWPDKEMVVTDMGLVDIAM